MRLFKITIQYNGRYTYHVAGTCLENALAILRHQIGYIEHIISTEDLGEILVEKREDW